ncbi:MAG: EF2563 family selenium-dependent molybdenum hydroxylase system protein [Candidatus Zixiibacteriota bacterium]|nr:MAG: EF2563 family selenium-dependent molybdenum hydroxylase system protein [candidate division Zixibacteria bacterium]
MSVSAAKSAVVIRGAGEMASGVIRQLAAAGFQVIALEQPEPSCIRRFVCYADAFYRGKVTVDGITAFVVNSPEEAVTAAVGRNVPVLIDPQADLLKAFKPAAVVDGRMLKENIDTSIDMAAVVIGLGPGFVAGNNCHASVETQRGKNLGRIFYDGGPQADTGVPAPVNGFTSQRVLRSPAEGGFVSCCSIGDIVKSGQTLGEVGGVSVAAEIDGMVRGLIHDGVRVTPGQKIGDVDPRCDEQLCYRMSDKAGTIGRSVLEALKVLSKGITRR